MGQCSEELGKLGLAPNYSIEIKSVFFLLMLWHRCGLDHHQVWYWPNKMDRCEVQGPFQYPIKPLLVRSLWAAKSRDLTNLPFGRCSCDLKLVMFKLISKIHVVIMSISFEIVLWWMPPNLTDDKSRLVQVHVIIWCCQATSHYLSQCWPRSMLPYGVIRPQWVKFRIVR